MQAIRPKGRKKRFIGLALGTALAALAIVSVWLLQTPNRVAEQETGAPVSIECWIYTKELVEYINEFEAENPEFHAEVRVFRSAGQLYEELSAAISANAAPQLAEIGGMYGLAQLADSGMLAQLDDRFGADAWLGFHPAMLAPFTYNQYRWALPVGGEVPVIYYNGDMARHADLNPSSFVSNVYGMTQAAKKLTVDINGDGIVEHWGLAVDSDTPWYLLNWAGSASSPRGEDSWLRAFRMWQQFVFEDEVMKPLQHHFALSDFIDGDVGMLISSSRKMPLLDRYIGGKFQYGVLPFPLFEGQQWTPNASGLAMLRALPEQERLALRLMEYMTNIDAQLGMLQRTGKIPSRLAAIDRMALDEALGPRERTVIRLQRDFASMFPSADDMERWERLAEITEKLESNAELELAPYAHRMAEYGPLMPGAAAHD
ncbi:hypothetical protein PAE9249_00344 [Paenibacillus sp. CECT 9249]|uniref:extracellular solute-binding protein n=1 Tax=Paenibacillus sp. CECT 9249 TaxID=2845385 RepID=UPI001E5814F8|nr:extracellular solute-binding protein [Paenibacillus sp. CECT 9249]CAH0117881.1 hypothetical protein PAE9249_00344 [Paenibacillus sp. CECT 9249]